jgi:hypothetical protein
MTPDSLPQAASPEHLTDALRRSSALGNGRVLDVTVESSRATLISRIIRLRLAYDGAVDAPGSLILKTGRPDSPGNLWSAGRHEVAFYTQVAQGMSARVVPRCFEASWNADTKTWHLLLEDLTDSHMVATQWPLPPTLAQCEAIVRARARFHAEWWDDPRLGISVGRRLDDDALAEQLAGFAADFPAFADRLGDRLPPERRALYERLLDAMPRLLDRYRSHRNATIIQGDAHVWNSFLPRDGGDDVRLFDWDGWRTNIGAHDLAAMMALQWYPDGRRRMERRLLDRYHEVLLEHGVEGYDRRALDDDYRLSVLLQISTPVWQASNNLPPVVWWNSLERILLAVDDLGCRDLLA